MMLQHPLLFVLLACATLPTIVAVHSATQLSKSDLLIVTPTSVNRYAAVSSIHAYTTNRLPVGLEAMNCCFKRMHKL